MRALHLVVTRAAGVRRGVAVFAGTRVSVRDLIDHLDRGEDLATFFERNPSVPPEQVLEACALGLEALAGQVPLDPPETQRSLLPRLDQKGTIVNAEELAAPQVIGRQVLCPGCRALVFKSWPEGWDGHAAHRCRGLAGSEPKARKTEFKRRFRTLFR